MERFFIGRMFRVPTTVWIALLVFVALGLGEAACGPEVPPAASLTQTQAAADAVLQLTLTVAHATTVARNAERTATAATYTDGRIPRATAVNR